MTILHIDSSARRAGSVGRTLARRLVDGLRAADSAVTYRDLADGVPLLSEDAVVGRTLAAEDRTAAQHAALETSEALIDELVAADTVVISVPIYNFGVPGALKAWIDQVAQPRRTFRYTSAGPEGLLKDKTVYLVMTSGGTPLDAPFDYATPYLRHVFGFLGIEDVRVVDATLLMKDEGKVGAAEAEIDGLVARATRAPAPA